MVDLGQLYVRITMFDQSCGPARAVTDEPSTEILVSLGACLRMFILTFGHFGESLLSGCLIALRVHQSALPPMAGRNTTYPLISARKLSIALFPLALGPAEGGGDDSLNSGRGGCLL
jgi:hypothetical protein